MYALAFLLIALSAACRVVPHAPNLVAMGAVALFAGSRLPRRWSWMVPIVAMVVSDVAIDASYPTMSVSAGMRLTIYGTYALMALAGSTLRKDSNAVVVGTYTLAGSVVFFLTTNLAHWVFEGGYPQTLAGLAACYANAIPFFRPTLQADLTGSLVLFGAAAAFRWAQARKAAPASELA